MTYGLIKIHSEVLSSLLIKWILEILSCKCILKGLETGTSDRSLICIIQRLRFSGFSLYPLSFFLSLQLDLFSPTSSSNFYVVLLSCSSVKMWFFGQKKKVKALWMVDVILLLKTDLQYCLCFQDSSGEAHGPTFKIEARFQGLTATAEGNSQNWMKMREKTQTSFHFVPCLTSSGWSLGFWR